MMGGLNLDHHECDFFFLSKSCVRAHGAIIRHICLTFIFYFIFVSFY